MCGGQGQGPLGGGFLAQEAGRWWHRGPDAEVTGEGAPWAGDLSSVWGNKKETEAIISDLMEHNLLGKLTSTPVRQLQRVRKGFIHLCLQEKVLQSDMLQGLRERVTNAAQG